VFGSVVVVAFQIAFRAEIHANDFFHFLKIIFDISTSKRSKKYKPHLILAKKKLKFSEKQVQPQNQTASKKDNKSLVEWVGTRFSYPSTDLGDDVRI
jgi:hypothetical protein